MTSRSGCRKPDRNCARKVCLRDSLRIADCGMRIGVRADLRLLARVTATRINKWIARIINSSTLSFAMNGYEKTLWVLPALADASPLVYGLLPYQTQRVVPFAVVFVCSWASTVVAVVVLTSLFLQTRRMIPSRSDGALTADACIRGTSLAVCVLLTVGRAEQHVRPDRRYVFSSSQVLPGS